MKKAQMILFHAAIVAGSLAMASSKTTDLKTLTCSGLFRVSYNNPYPDAQDGFGRPRCGNWWDTGLGPYAYCDMVVGKMNFRLQIDLQKNECSGQTSLEYFNGTGTGKSPLLCQIKNHEIKNGQDNFQVMAKSVGAIGEPGKLSTILSASDILNPDGSKEPAVYRIFVDLYGQNLRQETDLFERQEWPIVGGGDGIGVTSPDAVKCELK